MMTRIARCCCGSLRAEVTGEPWIVAICHCTECQRRTGSVFNVSAHFPKQQVRIEGPSKVYVRAGDSGRKVEFHFCPDCGTSVFWYAEARPDHIGIASGTFADRSMMPWPTVSIWEPRRHPWVTFDHPVNRFTDQASTPAQRLRPGQLDLQSGEVNQDHPGGVALHHRVHVQRSRTRDFRGKPE